MIVNFFKELLTIRNYKHDRVFGLDIFRATSIILVILIHGQSLTSQYLRVIPIQQYVGAVELFFILSGFLIGTIGIRKFENGINKKKILNFWIYRWIRILPMYFLIISLLLVYQKINNNLPDQWLYYYFSLQNLTTPHPEFFPVAWSLSIEEWFYLLFPLVSVVPILLIKNPKYRKYSWFVICLLCIFVGHTIRIILLGDSSTAEIADAPIPHLRRIVIFRFDSIAFGVFAAAVKYYFESNWKKYNLLLIPIALVILIVPSWISTDFEHAYNYHSKPWLNYHFRPIGYALLLPFFDSIKKGKGWIGQMITNISLSTYSIYLIHMSIVLPLVKKSYYPTNGLEAFILLIIYVVLCWVCGILLYKYIEKPTTDLRERFNLK